MATKKNEPQTKKTEVQKEKTPPLTAVMRELIRAGRKDETILEKTAAILRETRPDKDDKWIKSRAKSKLVYVRATMKQAEDNNTQEAKK